MNESGQMPQIRGTFINPHTGDKLDVQDCMEDNGQMVIKLTNGKFISMDVFSQYVQCEDDTINRVSRPIAKRDTTKFREVNDGKFVIDNSAVDDDVMNDDALNAPFVSQKRDETKDYYINKNDERPREQPVVVKDVNPNELILERAFDTMLIPDVNVTIRWDKNSLTQLKSLHKMMQIPFDDIVAFVARKLHESLQNEFTQALDKSLIKIK